MAKKMKKLIALTLALAMCFSMMAIGVQATGEDDAPEYVISLVPGKKTYAQREVSGLAGTTTYKLTATSTDVETATKQTIGEFKVPQPEPPAAST